MLDGMSYSTFPDGDEETQRFLDVVRVWATVPWDTLTVTQAAQRMTVMLPGLRAVCALRCASLHYTDAILGIRGQVVRICLGYEQAVAAQGEEKSLKKARETAAAKPAKAAKAVWGEREVEARASVTVETGTREGGNAGVVRQAPVVLTEEKSAALRAVVQVMHKHMFILEADVEVYHGRSLGIVQKAVAYAESCSGDETWIWNAEAWEDAHKDLVSCRDFWRRFAKKGCGAYRVQENVGGMRRVSGRHGAVQGTVRGRRKKGRKTMV